MYKVEFSIDAEQDLLEILSYIAQDNLERALSFSVELEDHIKDKLSIFPYSGAMHNEDKNVRTTTYKKYTTFYRVHDETENVEILHIIRLSKTLEARGIEF